MEIFINLTIGLWSYISNQSKRRAKWLVALMIFSALIELISIGAIFPILSILVTSSSSEVTQLIGFQVSPSFLRDDSFQIFVAVFVVVTVIATLIRLITLRLSTELVAEICTQISGQVFLKTLCQPYMIHISRNSSQILDAITNKMGYVSSMASSLLTLISTFTMFIFLVAGMFVIDAKTTFLGLCVFGAFYIGMNHFFKKRVLAESAQVSRETGKLTKVAQEALSAVRDIELDRSHRIFYQKFYESDVIFRKSLAKIQFISLIPRYIIEALALVFFILIAYLFVLAGKKNDVLIIFGPLILITQKLIPAIQQAYAALVNIKGSSYSLFEILDLLAQPMSKNLSDVSCQKIGFKTEILFRDVWFRYPQCEDWSAQAVTFTIPYGACIGFIGETGSGKSTIIDIVMGLLRPEKGGVYVDGQEIGGDNLAGWQACISHVPQSIYILDSSVLENIALGVPLESINKERVKWAAKMAQIEDVIDAWPLKYDTQLGERGIRLSGGQLQRIGVARALYRQSQVLILDEATSALDERMEERLINAIRNTVDDQGLKITIIMISHRLSTLRHCNYLIEVNGGKIISIDSHENVINRKRDV